MRLTAHARGGPTPMHTARNDPVPWTPRVCLALSPDGECSGLMRTAPSAPPGNPPGGVSPSRAGADSAMKSCGSPRGRLRPRTGCIQHPVSQTFECPGRWSDRTAPSAPSGNPPEGVSPSRAGADSAHETVADLAGAVSVPGRGSCISALVGPGSCSRAYCPPAPTRGPARRSLSQPRARADLPSSC